MLRTVFLKIIASLFLPVIMLCSASVRTESAQQVSYVASDFEQMLNMNFCYGESMTDDCVASAALLSLLEFADDSDIAFTLPETAVKNFIYAFYGRALVLEDCGLTVKDGKVILPACGYTSYSHKTLSAEDEDGIISVFSVVTVSPHDDDPFDALCLSKFVRADDSVYGYNLISSKILG